jgi:hypothetical protein
MDDDDDDDAEVDVDRGSGIDGNCERESEVTGVCGTGTGD